MTDRSHHEADQYWGAGETEYEVPIIVRLTMPFDGVTYDQAKKRAVDSMSVYLDEVWDHVTDIEIDE